MSGTEALHTRYSRGLVLLALGTGATGLALGNPALLVLAATVAALLHAARAGWPGSGEVRVALSAERVPRGRTVDVGVSASASGKAVHLLHVPLPPQVKLASGTNVHVVRGGALERFTVAAPKRGEFPLGPATLTALHPHGLAPAAVLARSEPAILTVAPRTKPLRRARDPRVRARQYLGEDAGLRGPGGSEFRELRSYERGDPLKAVNWKATARRSREDLHLMVNAFEPEARKDVWFFLDLSPRMEVGTDLDNALEDGIEAALALAHHFLGRGHRVGGATFNGERLVFYTEGGSRQELSIARALSTVRAGDGAEGLAAAAERVRGFLARDRPLVFVITRPDLDPEGLAAGARRIQRYAAGRRAQPVYVLAPLPPAASPAEEFARALQFLEAKPATGAVRVLPLRRGVQSLDAALAKGVWAR